MKKLLSVLLALAMILTLGACSANNETATDSSEEKKLKIGYISPGPDTWYLRAEEGAKWAADLIGAEFVAVNSNRDSQQELTNIDNLINEGCDVIVSLSWNENGSVATAQKANEAGIKSVIFDACGIMKNHEDVNHTASVDFDWYGMGAMYQNWMDTNYPGENYVFISGTEDSVVCQTLESALKAATEASGKNKCVDVKYGQYTPETAANVAEDLVNAGGDFSIIGVINEDCAAAIITRLEDLGVADKYHVFAQNGSETGIELMKQGSLEYTISSSPGLEGAVAVFAAVDAIQNGTADNTYVKCPIASVEPDSIDNPEVVIPWAVNETAWTNVIKANFPNYAAFLN